MKTIFCLTFIFTSFFTTLFGQRYWISPVAGNWSDNNWSSTSGGAPDGGGPPTAGVQGIFDANGAGDCNVDVAAAFDGLNTTGYTGTIDLNGVSFSITGTNACILAGGTINDTPGTSTLQINTTGVVRFAGTTFGSSINATGAIDFDAGTFNSSVSVTHGFSNQYGSGGCIFNGPVLINNPSNFEIRFATASPDIFNNTISIDNSGTSWIRLAYNSAGNQFNDDIEVSASGSANGISFGDGGSGSATFGAGAVLSIGSDFTVGDLILESITQMDATNISLDMNGTSRILFYYSNFLGNLSVEAPRVYLRENTFDGQVYFEKEGASNDQSYGGNTFNDITQLHLTGSGQFLMGNTSPDIWNADLTLTNEGTDVLYIAQSSAGNQLNGNITLECTSPNGIRFCNGASGTATLASGMTISLGGLGYTDGVLGLFRISQIGTTAQNLDLSGSARLLIDESTFNGDLTFSAPRIEFANSTFNGTVDFTKEGATTDGPDGGNTFNAAASFTHSGSNDWRIADTDPDIYNDVVTFQTSGDATARILPAYNSVGNQFNSSVTLENINSGGIYIGPGTGSSILAAGSTIQIGGAGFEDGILYLYSITQADATPISLATTGTTTARLSGNNLLGNISLTSSRIYVDQNTFSGTFSVEKTGAGNDDSAGGNTFGSTTTITNSGTGRILFGNTDPDIFNGDLFVNNTGTDMIYLAHNSASNQFNGNIELVNTTGNSIRFSQGGTGTSELANGQTITIGAGGFANGNLYLYDFTQTGNTAQNLALDNTARLYITDAIWEGNFTSTSGYFESDYSTYEGTTNITQGGSIANSSCSGNDFQDVSSITNNGGNELYFGVTDPSTFQADVVVNNSGSGSTRLAYQSIGNTFAGDVTLNNSGNGTGVYLGSNGATTTFTVTGSVTINESSAGNTTNSIANNGIGQINGDVTINNNSTATNCYNYLANGSGSQLTVDGIVDLNNNGAATNYQDIRVAWSGDVIFNQEVFATNNSAATNSYIRFAYGASSSATFNDNIELESTIAGTDGITFGESGGSSTLSATNTVNVGAGGYIDGNLRFRNFTQVGATAQSLTLTGDSYLYNLDSDWGGDVSFISPRHRTDGTTYNGTAYLEKSGNNGDNSAGGNTYNNNTTLVHSGSDNFLHGNGDADIVNGNLTINNSGNGNFYFAYNNSASQIDGDLDITNGATGGTISIVNSSASSTSITGNADVSNNSSNATAFYFPNDGTISVDGNLTIVDNTTSGSYNAYFADNSAASLSVGGDLDISLNTTGTTGRLYFGNGGSIDIDGDATFSNSSTCTNSELNITNGATASTTFNGNITLENYGAGTDGIYFGNGDGTTTLSAGGIINKGVNDFNTGRAQFRNFTQIGATAQNLVLTGDAYFYNVNSDWGGDVNFVAPRFRTDNTVYQGTAYLEKSGGVGDDQSQGNNSFAGDVQLVNSGSNYFMMGANNPDSFGGNLILDNIGSDDMFLAYSSTGNTITGDLTINHNGSGPSVNTCNGATSSLSIGGTATFDYSTSHANSSIYFPNDGDITLTGNLDLTQSTTGNASNAILSGGSNGSLTVNGNTTLTNNSTSATTGRLYLGNNGDITLNGTLNIFNNSAATNAEVYVNNASNSTGSFNGDINVESSALSDGIRFGASGGFPTLEDTYTLTVGAGGFAGTYLELRNFVQVGSTTQNIVTTGTNTQVNMRDAVFNADASFESARVFLRESTFEGVTDFTKTGANTDASTGGNTFNDDVTFDNAGTGTFRLSASNGFPDDYNANATFIESSSGEMRPTRNNSDTYAGDINLNSASQIYFGNGTNGRVIMDGNTDQNITDLVGGVLHRMRDFEVSKTGGDLYLASNFDIVTDIELNQGIVYSDASNYIIMNNNSNVAAVSNSSHVDGPIDKIGNDAFTFPVGDNGFYRPISISNPSSGSARFSAQYFDTDPDLSGYDDNLMDPTLDYISDCEYWILNRVASTNNVVVSLSYESYSGACSGVNDPATVSVARWDGSMWRDHGNDGSATPNEILSNGAVTSFSPFTLGTNNYPTNPLPVELLSFDAKVAENMTVDLIWQTASEINNDYFTIERSSDGYDFYPIDKTEGAGNSSTIINYNTTDLNPLTGTSFYRLKQTDYNGEFTYSNIVPVQINQLGDNGFTIYPNPISKQEEKLYINFNSLNERSIQIIDQMGQIVGNTLISSKNQLTISTQHLAQGVYLLKVVEGDKILTERFIVK